MKTKKLLPLIMVIALAWSSQMLTAQTMVFDDSDGPFTIFAPMVTVLSPNGSTNHPPTLADKICLSIMGSTNYPPPLGADRSTSPDIEGSELPTLVDKVCLSFMGGENWNGAETHIITWTSIGLIANVNIDYSIDNGSNWTPVAANIANSGSYTWTIQVTPSLNCRVRVSDPGNVNNNDSSDAVFLVSVADAESVSTPAEYIGPGTGLINTGYSFSNGAAESSLWHDVQYRFDWGDGSDSGWLEAGTISAAHTWTSSGSYQVRAMARAKKTNVESSWSTAHDIIMAAGINEAKTNH